MKTIITATAETGYQSSSLSKFGLQGDRLPDGSYYGEEIFDSKEEARLFLYNRANLLYQNGVIDEDEFAQMLRDLKHKDCMTIDAVTAYILKYREES